MSAAHYGTSSWMRSFSQVQKSLRGSAIEPSNQIEVVPLEDEFGRFRVWAANIGALQKGHSSLDYRLREAPLVQDNVQKLLKELHECLQEINVVLTGTRLPYDQQQAPELQGDNTSSSSSSSGGEDNGSSHGSSVSEPPMTELQQRFLTIVDIVDNLYKLSRMIRTPALQTRFSKAAAFKKIDRETGIDLIVKFRATDHEYVLDAFRSLRRENGCSGSQLLPQDLEFVRRVADGITKRRQQFMYWKRHRDKLGIFARKEDFEVSAVVRPEMLALPSGESATHHSQTQPRNLPLIPPSEHQLVHDTPIPGSIDKTDLTATTATIFISTDNFSESGQTTTSFATTARGLDGNRIELPSLPKFVVLGKDFECPYCFAIVPARYQSERGWRAHVLRDLKPYVCTYPSCPKHEVLFSDRKSWAEHEQWEHRGVWSCPEHFGQSFQVAEDFRCHLEEQPHKISEGLSSSALIDIGKSFNLDYRTNCVVCLAVCNTAETLQNHTANHLERFAAFSLPRDVDNSDNDNDLSKGPNSNSGESQAKSDDLLEPQMLSISAKTELIQKSLHRINDFRNGLDKITSSDTFTSETGKRLQILITAPESVVNQMSLMLENLNGYSDSLLVTSDPEGLNDVVSRLQRLENMLDSVRLEDFLIGTTLDDITEKLASDTEILSTFLASVKSRMSEPQTPFVQALFDFEGQDSGDLDFKKGDVIVVLETVDRGWWKGSLRGKVGVFPVNRVTPTRRSTTTDFNRMARAEAEPYAALGIAEKLANFSRLGKDYITEEQEESMQGSHTSLLAIRQPLHELLRKYTQKLDEVVQINERVIRACIAYEQSPTLLDEIVYGGLVENLDEPLPIGALRHPNTGVLINAYRELLENDELYNERSQVERPKNPSPEQNRLRAEAEELIRQAQALEYKN